jgi:hypothetical protein
MDVFIQSRHDGFRRCGEVHTREGRIFPAGHFTDEQLEQLNDDPEITMLAGVSEEMPDLELENGGGNTLSDLARAAGQAVADGKTIGSGAPAVEAMEEILGYSITSEQRDEGWAEWQAGSNA